LGTTSAAAATCAAIFALISASPRNEKTGHMEIDYDFCKGCGICAFICPKGAITMAREE